jgi:thiol-disulfide isomerase/thioredoxin
MTKSISIFLLLISTVAVHIVNAAPLTVAESAPPQAAAVVKNPYVKPVKPLIGAVRPNFILPDVNGAMREVSEWDGKVVILNFWATWCMPCLKEIPEFIQLQEKYGEQGLQFVGIALQEADEIKPYMMKTAMNYPSLLGIEKVKEVARSFGNRFVVLPYTVVIDRDSKIVFIRSGPIKYEETEELIKILL